MSIADPKNRIRAAAAAYPLDFLESWDAYKQKAERWVNKAVKENADILVFPEYGAIEIASIAGSGAVADLSASIDAVSQRYDDFSGLWCSLAKRYGVLICAPSLLYRDLGAGKVFNRALLASPSGAFGIQDKLIMTRFERDEWRINGGAQLRVFDTDLGRIGISVCYDTEFPLIARAFAEAGVEILLVPSVTETIRGYHRVQIGARARALENQFVVVHAPLVGTADWSPATDVSVGAAGIFGPPDLGFPEDGVIAQGVINQPGWVYGEFTLAQVDCVRRDGTVLNHQHWKEQDSRLARVETIDLVGSKP